MEVQCDKPGSDTATFSYGNWLDLDTPSCSISRWVSQIDYMCVWGGSTGQRERIVVFVAYR